MFACVGPLKCGSPCSAELVEHALIRFCYPDSFTTLSVPKRFPDGTIATSAGRVTTSQKTRERQNNTGTQAQFHRRHSFF